MLSGMTLTLRLTPLRIVLVLLGCALAVFLACASAEDPGSLAESPLGATRCPPCPCLADAGADAAKHDASPETGAPDATAGLGKARGTNLAGMEGGWQLASSTGPVAWTDYPVFDDREIDYFAGKGVTALRVLFSWERVQSSLFGPIPAPGANYVAYLANYDRVVSYATSRGMYVIVEPWQANSAGDTGGATWKGQLVGSSAVPATAFADFWAKMSARYASNPRVMFGLVNEPNSMSTMAWFSIAQEAINSIRAAGATNEILVPGNGWTGGGEWASTWYDTASPARSNAYGWLNANGPGKPLFDAFGSIAAEVHVYADANSGGGAPDIASPTVVSDRLNVAVAEGRARGYRVFLGEVGFCASTAGSATLWKNTEAYFAANADEVIGWTWWASGAPGWWSDPCTSGGGHFSLTPTNASTFTGDTANMAMIEGGF